MKLTPLLVIVSWVAVITFSSTIGAISRDGIKEQKWENLHVMWIEDRSTPTFSVQIYFGDGALSDARGKEGETDYALRGLFWGTDRFSQKEIDNNLEYFGSTYDFQVFHEYSTLSFRGLNRDIAAISKKYCHLFSNSIYPKREISRYTKRFKTFLGNLVTDHSALANHIFRRLSMRGTQFALPVEGVMGSIGNIRPEDLKRKRDYFNNKVKKKIYLRGNKSILKIKETLLGECGWGKPGETYVRGEGGGQTFQKLKTSIVLIPVKGANQAQIRLGRFLRKDEVQKPELLSLMSEYMGGSFISVLNEELRTKRGLVYSVGAFAQGQKYYGRSGISTFSRNEKVKEALQVIQNTLKKIHRGGIEDGRLERTVNFLKGSHLFQFESYDSFLRTIMFFDHVGRDWNDIYKFPGVISKFSSADIVASTRRIFFWDDLVILVVGDKLLLKDLREVGSVQVLSHRNYL